MRRVEPQLIKGSKILLVGEAPGEQEDQTGIPFSGSSGRLLEQILSQADLSRMECSISNVFKYRPIQNNIRTFYVKGTVKPERAQDILDLRDEINKLKPNIIMALGTTATRELTGEIKSLKSLRGRLFNCSLVEGYKVIPTYHPAGIMREWDYLFSTIMDMRKAKEQSMTKVWPSVDCSIRTDTSAREFVKFCNGINSRDTVALDIESTGGHVTYVGLAKDSHVTNIALMKGTVPQLDKQQEQDVLLALAGAAQSSATWVMHNGMYDMAVLLKQYGMHFNGPYRDTMIGSHVLWPDFPKDLGHIASILLTGEEWKHLGKTDQAYYNAMDAWNTLEIWRKMEPLIRDGFWQTFLKETGQVDVSMMLGLQGIKVNKERMAVLREESVTERATLIEKLDEVIGRRINLNSPQQLAKVLYDEFNLPTQYNRDENNNKIVTTDEKALDKLRYLTHHPVIDVMLDYRKVQKLISTYYSYEVDKNNRVYTSYNITGTNTGRWSSSKSIIDTYGPGNLQNIPKVAREVFVPDEGLVFLQADLKGAEAVIVAHITGDTALQQAFLDGLDVHKYTIQGMLGIKDIRDVTEDQRAIGKTLRHALNYGMGIMKLAYELDKPVKEARELRKLFFLDNPAIEEWHERVKNQLDKTMTLTNLLDRKRTFYERWGEQLFREAYAFVPQSTIGDLLNESLVKLYNRYSDDLIISLQLHDAIYVQCKEKDIEKNKERMRECMVRPLMINGKEVIIDVDFTTGTNWKDLKGD